MIRFAIIGAGWRAEYYLRVAQRAAASMEVCAVLCRSKEKAESITARFGVKAVCTEEELVATRPDFLVVSVTKASGFSVANYWKHKGYTVLLETPVGLTLEDIEKAYKEQDQGGALLVAEQYPYYPTYQRALAAVEAGQIGEVRMANLSICHEYHGFDVMRRMLGEAWDAPCRMRVQKYTFAVAKTGDRFGKYTDGEMVEKTRAVVCVEYADHKVGLYDFDSDQYHSTIRHNTMRITGSRGEIVDGIMYYLDEANCPKEKVLTEDFDLARREKGDDEAAVEQLILKAYAASRKEEPKWQKDNLLHGIMDAYMTYLMAHAGEEWMEVVLPFVDRG